MSTEAIARLRALFETELNENPALYHPIDISRMRTEDWQIRRFLLDHPDESTAFSALKSTLQWKKSYGLHTRNDAYFPLEFWTLAKVEIAGHSKNGGHLLHWDATRDVRSFKESKELYQQYAAHLFERVDRAAGELGVIMISDTSGTSPFHVDLSFEQFKVSLFDHYPRLLAGLYIVDIPWIAQGIVKLIISWMNPKVKSVAHCVGAEKIREIADEMWIPAGMKGGKRAKCILPPNLIPLEDRAKDLGLTEKFVDHFYKTVNIKRRSRD